MTLFCDAAGSLQRVWTKELAPRIDTIHLRGLFYCDSYVTPKYQWISQHSFAKIWGRFGDFQTLFHLFHKSWSAGLSHKPIQNTNLVPRVYDSTSRITVPPQITKKYPKCHAVCLCKDYKKFQFNSTNGFEKLSRSDEFQQHKRFKPEDEKINLTHLISPYLTTA